MKILTGFRRPVAKKRAAIPDDPGSRPRWVLAVDPGISGTGWALFDLLQVSIEKQLVKVGEITTNPKDSLVTRLAMIRRGIRAESDLVDCCVIEWPAVSGSYRRNAEEGEGEGRTFTGNFDKLYLTTGMLVGVIQSPTCVTKLVRAPSTKKALKQDQARMILTASGLHRQFPRDIPGNVLDAVYFGAYAIGRMVWALPSL